jgi:outer membrane receptor protein involved in Fe transport
LDVILGLRVEKYLQRHTGRDQAWASDNTATGKNLVNEVVLDAIDLFPSANLIYALNEKQNLRVAYSKTIARPSFKELSFAQILDPLTNRIFNGTLFTYPEWDGKLIETRIDNLDLRWEMFMENAQTVSFSAFFKQFDNPIELVRIPAQQTGTEFQPRNVGDGRLYGFEFEFRKDLGFISEPLSKLNLNGNFTYVESFIDMTDVEYNARKLYERTGQTVSNERQMAGQAPYVINAGIGYSDSDKGLDIGLYYNVKGPTLYIVGIGLYSDVYAEPFHNLDFGVNKKLGEEGKTVVDFKVNNILADRVESFFQSYRAQEQVFSSYNPGRTFSIGIRQNL